MIKNYLKITLRNLIKNKWFSFINITGLTIGITASLIIFLYINQELSFDKFHQDADRIFRVIRSSERASGVEHDKAVPYPLIGALKDNFLQFESSTLYHSDVNPLAIVDGEKFIVDHVVFADSNFFDVFSFKLISGNAKRMLGQPNYAFITASLADKLFGEIDPMGKKIKLRNKLDVEVAGLVEDIPANSHLRFDMIVSYPSLSMNYMGLNISDLNTWEMTMEGYAYVKLHPGASMNEVDKQFEAVVNKHYGNKDQVKRKFNLQPLLDIHFNQQLGSPTSTNPTSLWTLGVVGVFILLVACVNFVNLSTALSIKRSREVGVRKTLGAGRFQLVRQYLADTFIITFVSGVLAIGISERLIPIFNQYFNKELGINIFQHIQVLGFVLLVIVVVTLLSGLYPALALSAYNPVKALKNSIHSPGSGALFLRKGLIIVQFFISQVLIIATIVIANQMNYFTTKSLGFDKDAVINVDISKNDIETLDRVRNRLTANPHIKNVSFALAAPIGDDSFETHYKLASNTGEDGFSVQIKPADYYYKETYGLILKHGRWFTPGEEKSARNLFQKKDIDVSYILNETAVKTLGFSDPEDAIGVDISTGIGGYVGPIVGVVEDYHMGSFHEEIMPAIIMHVPMFYYNTGIKISAANPQEAINHVRTVFEDLFPDEIFEYSFLDDEILELYIQEQHTFTLFKIFSGISIFISSLGLLGMISFLVNQKTKEVGIRKVLGASIFNIVSLFSKEFILLVFIASAIAAPVAWYSMDQWLADFAYRIDLQAWFLIVAVLISAAITFTTIGYQSFKAAVSNPVDALRDE